MISRQSVGSGPLHGRVTHKSDRMQTPFFNGNHIHICASVLESVWLRNHHHIVPSVTHKDGKLVVCQNISLT